MYYYPGFQSSVHGDKLRHELARDLTRETAWEAVMRIRCGKGLILDTMCICATCHMLHVILCIFACRNSFLVLPWEFHAKVY